MSIFPIVTPLCRERRTVLDLETLRPHGKLSFIL
jgi:hypothetical protein